MEISCKGGRFHPVSTLLIVLLVVSVGPCAATFFWMRPVPTDSPISGDPPTGWRPPALVPGAVLPPVAGTGGPNKPQGTSQQLLRLPQILCNYAATGRWPSYPAFLQAAIVDLGRHVFALDDPGVRQYCANYVRIVSVRRPCCAYPACRTRLTKCQTQGAMVVVVMVAVKPMAKKTMTVEQTKKMKKVVMTVKEKARKEVMKKVKRMTEVKKGEKRKKMMERKMEEKKKRKVKKEEAKKEKMVLTMEKTMEKMEKVGKKGMKRKKETMKREKEAMKREKQKMKKEKKKEVKEEKKMKEKQKKVVKEKKKAAKMVKRVVKEQKKVVKKEKKEK
uniref:Uncharacterized protein n=1 Tax=Anopheles farauti TaxID=69004 RepID=A0A182QUB8_9DIPT